MLLGVVAQSLKPVKLLAPCKRTQQLPTLWCSGARSFMSSASGFSCSKGDNAIHWINLYPVDSVIGFPNTYPLDCDLSDGWRYPKFKQPGPGAFEWGRASVWIPAVDDFVAPFPSNRRITKIVLHVLMMKTRKQAKQKPSVQHVFFSGRFLRRHCTNNVVRLD